MRIHAPVPRAAFEKSHIRGRVRSYLFQAGLASLALLAILLIEQGVSNGIIVVTIASSTATVFVVPHSIASTPRRVVGGHVTSVIVGLALWGVLQLITGDANTASNTQIDIFGAAAVGLSVLVMATTNTEHPPAAGTAFGIIVVGMSFTFIAFILSAAVILSLVRALLRDRLQNLL